MRCFLMFTDNAKRLNRSNYVIRKSVDLKSVCIYHSGITAYGREIKTGSVFFDEVFHRPSFSVKFNEVLW